MRLPFVIAGLLLASFGCTSSRPTDVATQPGDCYCELAQPLVTNNNGEMRFKVRYVFPDGPPKYDAWFVCRFEIYSNSTSSMSVWKMGKELNQAGEFEAVTNAALLRVPHGAFAAQVKQASKKNGIDERPVSPRLVSEF
jgi:hypothetical protein